ncbi:MAG: mobile mystery protein A, partial [Gammaproteobacteria bacterium]
LRALLVYSRPRFGWIKTLRNALGMTADQLANRLGVNRSRVVRIEKDEMSDAITLKTLRRVAHALECDLVYALVPKVTLSETLTNKAKQIALKRLPRTVHTMALENQSVDDEFLSIQLEILIEELLNGNLKHLWEDE